MNHEGIFNAGNLFYLVLAALVYALNSWSVKSLQRAFGLESDKDFAVEINNPTFGATLFMRTFRRLRSQSVLLVPQATATSADFFDDHRNGAD